MLHPPKFPSNHPSFIELVENDDVMEKYEEKIMSIQYILTSDQTKQETFLKDCLAAKSRKLPIPYIRICGTSEAVS